MIDFLDLCKNLQAKQDCTEFIIDNILIVELETNLLLFVVSAMRKTYLHILCIKYSKQVMSNICQCANLLALFHAKQTFTLNYVAFLHPE